MKRHWICVLLLAFLLAGCGDNLNPEGSSAPPETTGEVTGTPTDTPTEPPAAPVTGWVTEDSVTCYLNQDGSRHTGWLELDGKRYYLDETGVLQTGWLELENARYYLQADGTMARGEVPINGRSHFFTADGAEIAIANPWNSIFEDYQWDLVEAENGYLVDRSCVDSLLQMLKDCRDAGYDAQITSAYRSHDTQIYLFDRKVNYFLDLGYDEEAARKEAGTIVAYPGTSEHELGLAVDLVDNSYWGLDEAQEHTPAQKWLMEHCWDYGFILRYPNNKSQYTGIIYEPWHYRYVGYDVAQAVHSSGLCLEEYLNTLY